LPSDFQLAIARKNRAGEALTCTEGGGTPSEHPIDAALVEPTAARVRLARRRRARGWLAGVSLAHCRDWCACAQQAKLVLCFLACAISNWARPNSGAGFLLLFLVVFYRFPLVSSIFWLVFQFLGKFLKYFHF
jgi:hypothetical protein